MPDERGCYGKYIQLGDGANLIWGEGDGYRAHALIEFNLPDTVIESAQLVLKLSKNLSDSGLRFTIYPITTPWKEGEATWMLANSATRWDRPGGDYDPAPLGYGVAGRDSFLFQFSPDQIGRLIRPDYRGILLRAGSPGFGACRSANTGTPPRLIIKYGGKTDTISASQDTYLVDTLGISPHLEMWVGSGFAYRSWFDYDLSQIPSDAVVVSAELRVGLKEVVARSDTLRVGVYRLTNEWDGPYTEYGPGAWVISRFARADTLVSFELKDLVQFWVAQPDSNFGLLLRLEPEAEECGRVVLSPDLPRLKVVYLLPPEGRFEE